MEFKRSPEWEKTFPGRRSAKVPKLVEAPIDWLLTIPGIKREDSAIDYNNKRVKLLAKLMLDKKWRYEHPILVDILHDGSLIIEDGNHRVKSAKLNGFKTYPCKIAFYGGSENHYDLYSVLAKYAKFLPRAAEFYDMGGAEHPPQELNKFIDFKKKKLDEFNQDMKSPGRKVRLDTNSDNAFQGLTPDEDMGVYDKSPEKSPSKLEDEYTGKIKNPQSPLHEQKFDIGTKRFMTDKEYDNLMTDPEKPHSYWKNPLPFMPGITLAQE